MILYKKVLSLLDHMKYIPNIIQRNFKSLVQPKIKITMLDILYHVIIDNH